MAKPVTHAELEVALTRFGVELRAELRAELATKQELQELKQELKQELERYATKQDLERFATKQDLERFVTTERFEQFVVKSEDTTRIILRAIEDMRVDLAQHVRVILEELGSKVAVVDDKYKSLPDRVARLEDAVLTPR